MCSIKLASLKLDSHLPKRISYLLDRKLFHNGASYHKEISPLICRAILSYRNQSIDFQRKSMVWLLYDRGFHHERVNVVKNVYFVLKSFFVLDVFQSLSWHFWSCRKNGLIRKLRLFSKFYNVTNWET